MLAVDRFRKDFGDRGLAGAPRPAKEIRVPDAVGFDLVL
jgi:hypothetical protein